MDGKRDLFFLDFPKLTFSACSFTKISGGFSAKKVPGLASTPAI